MEIERNTAPRLPKGFRVALQDVPVDRAFLVYGGDERYPKGDGIEAIGLRKLMEELATLDQRRLVSGPGRFPPYPSARLATSCRSCSAKASRVIVTCFFLAPRLRTATVPASASRWPTIAM